VCGSVAWPRAHKPEVSQIVPGRVQWTMLTAPEALWHSRTAAAVMAQLAVADMACPAAERLTRLVPDHSIVVSLLGGPGPWPAPLRDHHSLSCGRRHHWAVPTPVVNLGMVGESLPGVI